MPSTRSSTEGGGFRSRKHERLLRDVYPCLLCWQAKLNSVLPKVKCEMWTKSTRADVIVVVGPGNQGDNLHRRNMKRLSRHNLPSGRLKEEKMMRIPSLISEWTVRRKTTNWTTQCVSIIFALITLGSVAAESSPPAALDNWSTSTRLEKGEDVTISVTRSHALGRSGNQTNSLEATVASLVSDVVGEEVKQVEGTTYGIDTQLVVEKEKAKSELEEGTISTVPEAFTLTTATSGTENGGTMSSLSSWLEEEALSTTRPARTTTRTRIDDSVVVGGRGSSLDPVPDEAAELLPQNDQPARLGDSGLDTRIRRNGSVGYYYDNDDKRSNGKFGGGHQQQQDHFDRLQRDDESAGMVWSGVNINNDNGKGFNDMDIQCPSLTENSACPCYKFDDGE